MKQLGSRYLFNILAMILLFTQTGCFMLGVHMKVHNPSKGKKYPDFSERQVLLGAPSPYRSCYDVHFYELDIKADPKQKQLSGYSVTHAVAMSDFDTLQMDLYPNLVVDGIELLDGNVPLHYYRQSGAVFILMNEKVKKGTSFGIKFSYHGSPIEAKRPPWKGGFVWDKDKNKNSWIGVACESEGAGLWWPCKDYTGDEADSVVMRYTVPDGMVAVGNGSKISERKAEDNFTTYTWKVVNPINTYNITMYGGDFVAIEDSMPGVNGTLHLEHYVLKPNEGVARRHFQDVKPIISFFEKAFGPYPFYEDGFKLIEAPYEGMEHQSAIAYGSGFKTLGLFNVDYIMLHETAHEWWGNSVSAADFADIWLQEGFATYAEAMYVESKNNQKDYLSYLLVERLFIKNNRPIVGVRDRRYFDFHDSDVYMKGAWILHTLRSEMNNDTLFFDIIRTFAVENKGKLVSSDDFVKLVNDKTGKDYNWFFNHYLHNRQAPMLEYYIDRSDSGADVYFRWANTDASFRLPVQLIYNDDLGKLRKIKLIPSPEIQKVSLNDYPLNAPFMFDDMFKYFGKKENKRLDNLMRKK